jgi:hypothetical protein
MQAFVEEALPVLVIDGEIRAHCHYTSRDELAGLLADRPSESPAPEKSSGCGRSPGSGC